MLTVHDFKEMKGKGQKIAMVTCYDFWSAKLLNKSKLDALLVGDSLAMIMHGESTTLPATLEMMALHTQAVTRGAPDKFVIADLPFLSFRKGLKEAMDAIQVLMQAGAQAVKLEGVDGNEDIIKHTVRSGVPVMGHIGLTPQSIHQIGGFKVQGRLAEAAERLLAEAKSLEDCGCFSVVLECVPAALAGLISKKLSIPTIGIGAGLDTDGQILVLQDMLGLNSGFKPKFLRKFLDGENIILSALENYSSAVKSQSFPSIEESYE